MASRHPPAAHPDRDDPPPRPCPICGKPATRAARPFCSPRCRAVDLHRWLSGAYAIPVVEDTDEDGDR